MGDVKQFPAQNPGRRRALALGGAMFGLMAGEPEHIRISALLEAIRLSAAEEAGSAAKRRVHLKYIASRLRRMAEDL
jgi:hypothetical protein